MKFHQFGWDMIYGRFAIRSERIAYCFSKRIAPRRVGLQPNQAELGSALTTEFKQVSRYPPIPRQSVSGVDSKIARRFTQTI